MSAHPDSRDRFRPYAFAALIVVAGVAAYANSFQGDFIFDDYPHIVAKDRSPGSAESWLSTVNRPVLTLSLTGNYALGELDPFGYHLVNLVIHVAAALALFGLVRRTLVLPPSGDRRGAMADGLAFAVAVIWLVHPLATQSVTYIIQRAESLMGLFYILMLYCLLRGSQASRRWPWYVGSVAACWLGMGTKQVMITAPLVALLYDRTFLAGAWRDLFRCRWMVYVGFVPAVVWLAIATPLMLARQETISAGFGLQSIAWYEYLGTQGGVILHYLRLAVWPDRLSFDYWWPVARSTSEIVVPGAVVAALLVASLVMLRARPRLGFLGISFFLILAPTSSIMPIADRAVEHRMYLPLAPLVVLAVLGFDSLVGRLLGGGRVGRIARGGVLVAAVLLLMTQTIARNRDYRSPAAMWQDVLEVSPENPRAFYNFGNELEKIGDDSQALAHYERAVELLPGYAEAHNNMGVLLERRGNADRAVDHYREAIRINPRQARAHNNLGVVLVKRDELADAAAQFRRALESDPAYSQARYHLAGVLQKQGNDAEAMEHFRQTVATDPDNAGAHYSLGVMLARQGELAAAITHYLETVRIDPTHAEAHNNLGVVFSQQGDFATAGHHLEQAVKLKPDFALAHDNLGNLLAKQGMWRMAVDHYRRAIEVQPDMFDVAVKLARILAANDDASIRNGPQAVGLAEHLVAATGKRDPAMLDILAAAYAEVGRWEEAVAATELAIALAQEAGQDMLAEQIEDRRQLYQQQKPFRDRRN